MSRYIDVDEFIKRVIQYPRQSTKTIGIALADTPTADVVEVVRCKDCKHRDGDYCNHNKYGYAIFTYDNDFCSRGERS